MAEAIVDKIRTKIKPLINLIKNSLLIDLIIRIHRNRIIKDDAKIPISKFNQFLKIAAVTSVTPA